MNEPSPILARWNEDLKCIDAKVIEQEGSTWGPLGCSDHLTRSLRVFFAYDSSLVIKVTLVQNPAGWWEERLEKYEGVL